MYWNLWRDGTCHHADTNGVSLNSIINQISGSKTRQLPSQTRHSHNVTAIGLLQLKTMSWFCIYLALPAPASCYIAMAPTKQCRANALCALSRSTAADICTTHPVHHLCHHDTTGKVAEFFATSKLCKRGVMQ